MPLVEKVRDAMPTRVRTTADGKTEEATIQFEEGKGGQTVQDLDDIATAMGVCAEGLLHKTMTFPRIGNISDARIASRTTLMSSMEPGERPLVRRGPRAARWRRAQRSPFVGRRRTRGRQWSP